MADTQLEALVADVEAKETALASASDTNTAAQAAAQSAVAQASTTAAAQQTAHQALSDSIDALVTFVEGLKGTTPAPAPTPPAGG